jgi:hypothetical protein
MGLKPYTPTIQACSTAHHVLHIPIILHLILIGQHNQMIPLRSESSLDIHMVLGFPNT